MDMYVYPVVSINSTCCVCEKITGAADFVCEPLGRWNTSYKSEKTKEGFLIRNILVSSSLSDLFDYLCYGSTAIINIFLLFSVCGRL